MDKAEIEAIRARCEAAYDAPWLIKHGKYGDTIIVGANNTSVVCDRVGVTDKRNAELIAHAPEDIPVLLDETARKVAIIAEKDAEIARLTRERDTAVEDLKSIGACRVCAKFRKETCPDIVPESRYCWQWRGVEGV